MKKIIIILCIALSTGLTTTVLAQKTGHINSNDLLLLMPERKAAESAIQEEAKKLEVQLKTMSGEYQSKVADYQANAATMSELIQQTKAKEITDLEQRIQAFQTSAQENLKKKESDLLAPIIAKAKEAIETVAKEKGYDYVIDSSTGVLLTSPAKDNLLEAVKTKLGIK